MNPVMFIPFVLVQPILAAITLAACLHGHHSSGDQYCTRGPCQPVWEPSLTPTVASPHCWSHSSTFGIATLIYLPFVVVANKAQNAIDKEESEEDIANALKF